MLKFTISIIYIIFDYLRYQKNLIKKKEIDKSLFYDLKKNLNKNLFTPKINTKKHKGNLLIACFVHQLGYIYTDCLVANYLVEIKSLKLVGLMDDNDNTTKEFLNCFNSKNNIFLTKLKLLKKVKGSTSDGIALKKKIIQLEVELGITQNQNSKKENAQQQEIQKQIDARIKYFVINFF